MGLSKGPSHDGRWKIVRKSLREKERRKKKKKNKVGFVSSLWEPSSAVLRCIVYVYI